MTAGIRVWVLTGDKQETAIEIGKSCNLINLSNMDLHVLSSKNLDELILKLQEGKDRKGFVHEKMSIVIDGYTLTMVLENERLADEFYKFGCLANSVICCRVSPKQKSDVVSLSKRNGT
jgi:magnesium-transporting ATPase (P-type)